MMRSVVDLTRDTDKAVAVSCESSNGGADRATLIL